MTDPTGRQTWLQVPVELPDEGRTAAFEARDRHLLLCNVGGSGFVLANRCPHAKAALSGGRLSGFVLECPLHGGKLDVRDGSPVAKPIRKAACTFAVRDGVNGLEVALPNES